MRILVTGSRGYIGSKLFKALEDLGHEMYEFDKKIINSHLEDIPQVDLVYHFAAQTDVRYSTTHALIDAEDNIILTLKVLEKFPSARIIYPASAASLNIQSPYGLSKKVGEDYIKLLRKDYVILRFPNIWGDGGHGAIDIFQKADVINIFGDGEQSRTIVHVKDVVKACVKALNWAMGEYSLGGEDVTINEIARRIGKPIVYHPKHEGEIFACKLENTTPDWNWEIKL